MGKTSKQVMSGYHRPVCKRCECEMRPETNGIGVLDMGEAGPYELFAADLWKCPKCGIEVVGGFGNGPVTAKWQPDFDRVIQLYATRGLLVRNNG